MRSTLTGILAMVLVIGVATGAKNPRFEDVDADGDGRLNETEAIQAGVDLETADENGDGMLDRSEYQAALRGEVRQDERDDER